MATSGCMFQRAGSSSTMLEDRADSAVWSAMFPLHVSLVPSMVVVNTVPFTSAEVLVMSPAGFCTHYKEVLAPCLRQKNVYFTGSITFHWCQKQLIEWHRDITLPSWHCCLPRGWGGRKIGVVSTYQQEGWRGFTCMFAPHQPPLAPHPSPSR